MTTSLQTSKIKLQKSNLDFGLLFLNFASQRAA